MKAAAIACVIAAWLMFLASFFLPAMRDAAGWEVLSGICAIIPWMALMLILGGESGVLWVLVFPLTNALMLVSPMFVLSSRANAWMMAPPLIVSGVIPWLLPSLLRTDVLIGYYVWDASFFLTAIGSLLLTAAENRARWMLLTSPAPEMELQFLLKNRILESPAAEDTAAGAGDNDA